FQGTVFVWMIPIAIGVAVYLWFARPGLVLALTRRVTTLSATLGALAVTAVLGYALNDSGVAIPAMMLIVGECAVAFLILGEAERTADPEPDGAAARQQLWRDARPTRVVEPIGERDPVA
ncbi:MAG TPA: hypothetical protein VFF40_02810, partial [Acidimicrobiia bacterium]|nr:hypothetical protein [Acidimicrobiia bacterium]